MTIASTWMDLVAGMDVHLELVPTPAGPMPTPIPQPYFALVGLFRGELLRDTLGTAWSLVKGECPTVPPGPVYINGLPATTTASMAQNGFIFPHEPLPPGTAFPVPPSGDASFPTGVLHINFRGANPVRGGDVAMSCSDPVPLPTSQVIAIPKGPPVIVDGVPGTNIARVLVQWAVGAGLRTLWGAARASPIVRGLARQSATRLRNLISKARCFVTGHPIDVATGRVFTEAIDFQMPGPMPVVFERTYFSSWSHRPGPLGRGWSHSLDLALWFERDLAVFRNEEGQEIVFALPDQRRTLDIDEEVFEPLSGATLARKREGWVVVTARGIVHRFARVGGDPGIDHVLRVTRTSARNPEVGVSYAYDAAARLAAVTDAAGRTVRLEYNDAGRLARVLGPDATAADTWVPVAEYAYGSDGMLSEARDALGHATRYAYDGGLLVQEIDRNGVAFFWIYDGRGSGARCVRTWGSSGDETIYNQKLDYDREGRTTLVSDSYGGKTLYRTNALGAVVEIVDALGGKTAYEYDDALRLTAEVDPLGNRTTHQYGPRGQLLGTVFPDGARVILKHDPRHPELVTLSVDEMGAAWRYRYDVRAQLVEVRGPEPDAWQRIEWDAGRVAAVVDGNGARTEVIARDRRGNAVRVRLPNGAEARAEFDRRGHCVATVDARGARRTFAYDAADRLVGVGDSGGDTLAIARNPLGQVVEVAGRQRVVRFRYGASGRLVAREEGGDTVALAYGQEGELRAIRNENREPHTLAYDPCLRLERELGFDLQETRYHRNAAGWTTKVARAGARVESTYARDARGRVTSVKHSDGTWARFAYRKDGELVEAANPSGTVTFVRDALGRVIRERQGDVEVRSSYAGGFRTRVESSLGAGLAVARDLLGNPTSVTIGRDLYGGAVAFEHDAGGLEIGRSLPGGVRVSWQRDAAGRPARLEVGAPGAGAFAREHSWPHGDRLSRIDDSRFGRTEYLRDARGRLCGERHASHQHAPRVATRELDPAGNVYRTIDRTDREYGGGGVLRRAGDTTFAFDPLGNLVERVDPGERRWSYAWDGAGMLSEVTGPGDLRVKYAYDALGRRIASTGGAADTRWIWDGDVVLHELRSDRAPATWYHEPETFAPLAQITRDGATHVVTDHLGAPTAGYDDAGALAWQMQLDLFGVARDQAADAGPSVRPDWPFRWPGQHHDPDTGLHYNRFRYYDPALGQYISQDPLGLLGGGLAPYAYVDDPTTLADPWGLMEMDPWAVRFSQRSVGPQVTSYTEAMREGRWDWSRSGPLRIMPVGPHFIGFDNRRLMAAQNAGLATVPVTVVNPSSPSGLRHGKTWWQEFRRKRISSLNAPLGNIPPVGVAEQPRIRC